MNIRIILNDLKKYDPKLISDEIIITSNQYNLPLIITTYTNKQENGQSLTFYRVSDNYEIASNTEPQDRGTLLKLAIHFCNQAKDTNSENWLILPIDFADSTQVFSICGDTINPHYVKKIVEKLWKFAKYKK